MADPGDFQSVAAALQLVPLTYSNRLKRAVMVKGLAPWPESLRFAAILVFVVLTIAAASLVLRQSAQTAEQADSEDSHPSG